MSAARSLAASVKRILPEIGAASLARHLGDASDETCQDLLASERAGWPLARLLAASAEAGGLVLRSPQARLALAEPAVCQDAAAMAGAWLHGRAVRNILSGRKIEAMVEHIGRQAFAIIVEPDAPALPAPTSGASLPDDPGAIAAQILEDGRWLVRTWLATSAPAAHALLDLRATEDVPCLSARPDLPVGAAQALAWIVERLEVTDV
jgi:hypothetical protein